MSRTVLVTGSTGHLGKTLCQQLLNKGYRVIAGVRNKSGDARASHLASIGAKLVELDVLKPALLKDHLDGVDCVFHLAAIYQFAGNYTSEEIKNTAVDGTLNVLGAVRSSGVPQVVMTSSTVAVGSNVLANKPLDESNWNTTTHEPYAIAKTFAELGAYKFCDTHNIRLNTICPAAIIGPNFSNHTPTTLPIELALTGELKAIPPFAFSFVDVRDVANAHILAYERGQSSERYIASAHYKTMEEMVKAIKVIDTSAKIPRLKIPKLLLPLLPYLDSTSHKLLNTPRFATKEFVKEFGYGEAKFNSSKLTQELDWKPRAFEESLEDTVNWIKSRQQNVELRPLYS